MISKVNSMNRVLLQVWVESRPASIHRDGCSLHMTAYDLERFVGHVYAGRECGSAPSSYEMALGSPMEAYVDDAVYASVFEKGSVRLEETSLRNLMSMEEIIVKSEI